MSTNIFGDGQKVFSIFCKNIKDMINISYYRIAKLTGISQPHVTRIIRDGESCSFKVAMHILMVLLRELRTCKDLKRDPKP